MLRLILVLTFVTLFLILSIPLMLIEWVIGKFNPELKSKSSLAIVNWAFRCCLFFAGTKLIVIGKEKVPTDTAVLYVGNHRSFFDILITYINVLRPTGYISKIEVARVPLLNVWMKYLHCLFLNRKDIKQGMKIILTAIEQAKQGISFCIFPEGTRNKVKDTFLPFHDASFKIASKANIPVVPMSIVNCASILEDHMPFIRKATVILEYCEPIYINELENKDRKAIGNYVSSIIQETYYKNKENYHL